MGYGSCYSNDNCPNFRVSHIHTNPCLLGPLEPKSLDTRKKTHFSFPWSKWEQIEELPCIILAILVSGGSKSRRLFQPLQLKHEDNVEHAKKLFTYSKIRKRDDDAPLAQFDVAFDGISWTHPDSIALMVKQAMLGSWNKTAGAGGKHMSRPTTRSSSQLPQVIQMMATSIRDKTGKTLRVFR